MIMKALTVTRPSAPVVGSTPATSVTCRDDQSVAVPSERPKARAMAPRIQAALGIGVFTPSIVWGTTAALGVILKRMPSPTSASTAIKIDSGVTIAPPSKPSRRASSNVAPAPTN